jgi:hypothetical protein
MSSDLDRHNLQSLFGSHSLANEELSLEFGEHQLSMRRQSPNTCLVVYQRNVRSETIVHRKIAVSGGDYDGGNTSNIVGVFPSPATQTPKKISSHVYLKFTSPIVLDQQSSTEFYTAFPIEITVYRQSGEEELMLDAFSLSKPKYALYGSPEKGILCRFAIADIWSSREESKPVKYKEALAHVVVKNDIDNIVSISKLVFPIDGVVLDHQSRTDDAVLPGYVEMHLDQAFGKDIVRVELKNTRVKRSDKTSSYDKEHSLTFSMDAGY